MSESADAEGGCLCGAIHVAAKEFKTGLGACHCTTCRKWGSGPYLSIDCGTEVSLDGEENLTVFDSSQWAERGFCKQCGSHIFYRLKDSGQYFLSAAILDDDSSFDFDHQIFIDEKPAYYTFANKTEDMTGAEVFAKFASPSD